MEPSVGFEPTCPYGSALQVRCNRPLCEEGSAEEIFKIIIYYYYPKFKAVFKNNCVN